MSSIIIELNEASSIASLTYNINEFEKSTKFLSVEDLIKLLNDSKEVFNYDILNKDMKDGDIVYDSTLMPSFNGVSVIQNLESTRDNKLIVIKKEACRRDFVYHKSVFENVGIPTLLFFLYINSQNVIFNAKLFSVKESLITENTEIFHYPFTNVGLFGNVCFGDNKDKLKLNSLLNLYYFPDKFFQMPSTHDYNPQNRVDMNIRPFLEKLKNKDFNNDYLKSTNKTYKEILSTIKF